MADGIFTVTKSIDPRLTQPAHSFCAAQGASSISIIQVAAASSNPTNLTFSVIPPSPQVVIQKTPLLDVTLTFQLLVCQSNGSNLTGDPTNPNSSVAIDPNGVPFAVWGRDIGVGRAAPLGQIVNAFNITINNAAVQQQNPPLADLTHVLEGPKGRASHGTMFRTPLTASWDDSAKTLWGLNASGSSLLGEGDVGPGVFNVQYCDDTGKLLEVSNVPQYYPAGAGVAATAQSTWYVNGVPITDPNGAGQIKAVYVQMRMIDAIMCSPFGFSYDTSFKETGLYGISSLTVQAQLTTGSVARIIQGCSTSGCVLLTSAQANGCTGYAVPGLVGQSGDLIGRSGSNGGPVQNARLWMTYLSPSIQSTLPPRSIATLCNLQYFQQSTNTGAQASPGSLFGPGGLPKLAQMVMNFNSVTFSNVPDLIMISIRPDLQGMSLTESDWQCTLPDNAIQQFTFANQSGLFSGWTSEALSQMSRNNGSRASLAQYGGSQGSGLIAMAGRQAVAGGSVLLIRPGVDFPLPSGVSVGSTGQVQLAFQILFNAAGTWNTSAPRKYVCTVTAISSGFFVTDNGVSRQLLVGLDEATVLAAPEGPDRFVAQRLAGGSFHNGMSAQGSGFGDWLKKAAGHAASAAQHIHANKDHYIGMAQKAHHHVTQARHAMRTFGGSMSGDKRSLAERLAQDGT